MNTPGPERPLLSTIYGACASRINRRALIGCGLLLPVAARAGRIETDDPSARAIAAMGGREILKRVKALTWEARAEVTAGGRTVAISARTRCEPFGTARSESWLRDKGPETARIMTITAEGGTLTRDGKTSPLPEAMAAHERQQFGIYGHMLLVHSILRGDGSQLVSRHAGYPDAKFEIGTDGLPLSADYDVRAPQGEAMFRQRFQFGAWKRDKGVRWPGSIVIIQNDAPFFAMTIDQFSIELA